MWPLSPFARPVSSFEQPVIPPDSDADAGTMTVACFSLAWLPFLLGAAKQLLLQSTWLGDETAQQLAQYRANDLLAFLSLNGGNCPNMLFLNNVRYNSGTNTIQQSSDGGTTWHDNPALDPRTSDAFRFPPLTTDTARCDAAARIVAEFKDVLQELFSTLDQIEFAYDVLSLIATILGGGGGLILDIIALVADLLYTIGRANIEAAFTDAVWSGIECIIYCQISDNGQVSQAQNDAIIAKINTAYPGTVSDTISALIFLYGDVLMSNAGVTREESGGAGCDDCSCGWCFEFDFTTSDGGWTVAAAGFGNEGEYVSGLGWRMSALQDDGCGGHGYLNISFALGLTTDNISGLELWWQNPNADGTTQFFDQVLAGSLAGRDSLAGGLSNPNPSFSPSPVSCDTVRLVNFQCGQNESVPFYISKARFSGTGVNPFGADNC